MATPFARHWYVNEVGAGDQVPGTAVVFTPTRMPPDMEGAFTALGATPLATATAALEAVTAGCPALWAVTATDSFLPSREAGAVYEDAVAPAIATPLLAGRLERGALSAPRTGACAAPQSSPRPRSRPASSC